MQSHIIFWRSLWVGSGTSAPGPAASARALARDPVRRAALASEELSRTRRILAEIQRIKETTQ